VWLSSRHLSINSIASILIAAFAKKFIHAPIFVSVFVPVFVRSTSRLFALLASDTVADCESQKNAKDVQETLHFRLLYLLSAYPGGCLF